MTKKIIGIIAAIGILIYGIFFVTSGRQVFSISNPFQNNVTVQHKKPAELKIGVSLSTLNNPFFISIKDGVNEVANHLDQRCKCTMDKIARTNRATMWKI